MTSSLLKGWDMANHSTESAYDVDLHNYIIIYVKGRLPNYLLKISVIMTLSFGPPPPPSLSAMAKAADSHTWT